MKERPILFSEPMVQAILYGKKTQTRRQVKTRWKPAPLEGKEAITSGWATIWPGKHTHTWDENGTGGENWYHDDGKPNDLFFRKGEAAFYAHRQGFMKCPYGKVGDRLWVRETWSPDAGKDIYPFPGIWYRASDPLTRGGSCRHPKGSRAADCLPCWEDDYGSFRWRPSIHMPKRVSRITLEITDVRVQPLQEISQEDAVAEGVEHYMDWLKKQTRVYDPDTRLHAYPTTAFARLWDKINGNWKENPWCWALTFKKMG